MRYPTRARRPLRKPLPHPAALLAGYVAVAGGLSVLIVTARMANDVLTLMLVPVVLAALFYGRAVYLPMIGALTALDLWVISRVLMDAPGEAVEALIVLLLTGTLMAEIVHRLTRERARTEDAVRASEAHFRSLIENSSDISAFVDAHGVVVYGSPSIQRVLGYIPAELVGRDVLKYVHPDDAAPVERMFDRALQGEGDHEPIGLRFRHKDGTWRHLEAVLVCRQLSPGEPPAVVINCRDVTERRRADDELMMERHVLRLLIDSIPDNIYIKDRAGRLVIANEAMARAFGMEASADLIGKTDFDLFAPEVAERYRERELRVIEGGAEILNVEELVVDKIGHARWVLLTKLPLRDGAGNITGLAGVSRDVTERRRTEDELRRLYEAERQRRRLAEALREAGNTLSATLDLNEVLDHLLVQIQTIVPFDASAVLLVEDGRARVARSRGYERYGAEVAGAIAARAIDVAAAQCLQDMARSGQPMVVSDTAVAEQCVRELHSPSVGSCLGAPVMSRGEMIAFFTLEKEEHGFYQSEHAAYLAPFTAQAALALQNARLYEETAAALERERTYNEIARAASSMLDLPDILQNMTRLAARLVGADSAALSLVTADGQIMHTPYIYNLPPQLVQPDLKQGEGVAWHIAATGEAVLLGEYDAHPLARPDWAEAGVHGFIGVPIVAGEMRLGALGLFSLAPHRSFTARDVAVAAAVGQQAGSAIQRAQLFDEVRQLAVTDALTGLYNRRYFFTLAEQEFAQARAQGKRLGILMVDIDYFKHVNDTYGHVAGDRVLEYVAGCCQAGVSLTDEAGEAGVLARYGGEEFVALFRGMGQPEVDAIAQAVCACIRQPTVAAGGHAIAVTASVGSAELDDTCAAMEDLLVHADRALYVAKRAGGDRAVAWQGEPAIEIAPEGPAPCACAMRIGQPSACADGERAPVGRAVSPPA